MPAHWTRVEVDAPDKPLLSAGDVAGLLGYENERSVFGLVARGQLPEPLRRGATPMWSREDVILCVLLIKNWDRMHHGPEAEGGDEPEAEEDPGPKRSQKVPKGAERC